MSVPQFSGQDEQRAQRFGTFATGTNWTLKCVIEGRLQNATSTDSLIAVSVLKRDEQVENSISRTI
jgi:hypothetical protein